MNKLITIGCAVLMSTLLNSCEFKCNLGDKKETSESSKETSDGSVAASDKNGIVYNSINLQTSNVKIRRAHLQFESGERVPEDNKIDFTVPVKMVITIDTGWHSENGRVWLGASEKIETEGGQVLLDEPDLFQNLPEDGISETDAKIITLTARIILNPGSPPTSFKVSFRIWDKKGTGEITGHYNLYSK